MVAGKPDELFDLVQVIVEQYSHYVDSLPAMTPGGAEMFKCSDGLVEGSWFSPPAVVLVGVSVIKANRSAPQTSLHELTSVFCSDF